MWQHTTNHIKPCLGGLGSRGSLGRGHLGVSGVKVGGPPWWQWQPRHVHDSIRPSWLRRAPPKNTLGRIPEAARSTWSPCSKLFDRRYQSLQMNNSTNCYFLFATQFSRRAFSTSSLKRTTLSATAPGKTAFFSLPFSFLVSLLNDSLHASSASSSHFTRFSSGWNTMSRVCFALKNKHTDKQSKNCVSHQQIKVAKTDSFSLRICSEVLSGNFVCLGIFFPSWSSVAKRNLLYQVLHLVLIHIQIFLALSFYWETGRRKSQPVKPVWCPGKCHEIRILDRLHMRRDARSVFTPRNERNLWSLHGVRKPRTGASWRLILPGKALRDISSFRLCQIVDETVLKTSRNSSQQDLCPQGPLLTNRNRFVRVIQFHSVYYDSPPSTETWTEIDLHQHVQTVLWLCCR